MLQDDIIAAIGENELLHDLMFTSYWASQGLHTELAQIKDKLARARKCRELQDVEPGWNEQVHCRVIELALKHQPAVGFQDMYVLLFCCQHPPCDH